MTRSFLLFLFMVVLPDVAAAQVQTLTVRSGEHGAFTRLVIDVERPGDWQLAQNEDGTRVFVRFPGRAVAFDTSAVFDRIDRARIAAVTGTLDPNGLEIELNCRCRVDAFQSGARMLVLDIREGTPEIAEAVPTAPAALAAFSSVELGPIPSIGPRSTPSREPFAVPSDASRASDDRIAEDEAAIRTIQEQLTLQLARAATSGLLESDLNADDDRLTGRSAREPDVFGADTDPIPDARDASLHVTRTEDRVLLSGSACAAQSELNIADWAEDTPFVAQLGTLRQGLLGEFDAADEEAIVRMARFYLHFGMGPEARSTLHLLEGPKPALLTALAEIIEDGDDPNGVFQGQMGCSSPASMWAVLAHKTGEDHDAVNTASLLRGFDELPTELSDLVVTRLSDNLRAMGERQTARTLLQRVQRNGGQTAPEVVVARAQFGLEDGDNRNAVRELTAVARRDDGHASAEALATLMGLSVAEGMPAEEDLTELASAYSVEYRGAEQGPDMRQAHIRALISAGKFDTAYSEISTEAAPQNQEILPEFYRALTERASDTTFMKFILRDQDSETPVMQPMVHMAATQRMLALGLPDAAQTLLERSPVSPQNRDRKLLSARIHLAKSEPQDAEIALIGLQGEDVLAIRAEAREQMGDYDFVQNAMAQIGEPEQAASAAWISGDWSTVVDGEDGILASAAELIQRPPPGIDSAQEPSLGASLALADESATSIDVLRQLLEETRISPDSP